MSRHQQSLASAKQVMERCLHLASYSEETDCLTRRFATPAMRAANEQVAEWMSASGMEVREDTIGNVIGRYGSARSSGATLLIGSHLDTVRNAGKYDGPLGVLIAIECIALLHRDHRRLPFAVEVYGFADEEGLRYQSAYLGSKAVVGGLDADTLALVDREGIPLATALRNFGGDPTGLLSARRRREDVLGYCEVHIEQGPRLEQQGLPVGIVSAVAGQTRARVTFAGTAGHAGTVPALQRKDALTGASEFILAVESHSRRVEDLMATVGQISAYPGASNVIPGQVELSLDVRHQSDDTRLDAVRSLFAVAKRIAAERTLVVDFQIVQSTAAVRCDAELSRWLEQAVREQELPAVYLPSGAGHDAAVMAELTGSAMLFVRCRGGISHSPMESVSTQDVGIAIAVMVRFVDLVAERYTP